ADPTDTNLVVANPDQAHVAPAVITLDETARWRDVHGSGIGARNGDSTDQCAGGKSYSDASAPVRMGLGTAAGDGKAARECQRGDGSCGDLGLGHGGLHPAKFRRRATAAICMGRAGACKGSMECHAVDSTPRRARTK